MNSLWGQRLSAGILLGLFTGVIGFALWQSKGPFYQRDLRLDEKQLQLIETLQHRITQHYKAQQTLPGTVHQLGLSDVQTQQASTTITYQILSSYHEYLLCSQFRQAAPGYKGSTAEAKLLPTGSDALFWQHPKGRYCFHFDVKQPDHYFSGSTYFVD